MLICIDDPNRAFAAHKRQDAKKYANAISTSTTFSEKVEFVRERNSGKSNRSVCTAIRKTASRLPKLWGFSFYSIHRSCQSSYLWLSTVQGNPGGVCAPQSKELQDP